MLRHLRVTNFAILSDVELELGAGLNVLTGETGAGKSLIVEAVNLLRGGRASADIPRTGADEAVVEAVVEIPIDLRARVTGILEAAGLPTSAEATDDGVDLDTHQVFIRRVIQRGGRSRTYVNGALTTAARLAELGALLIDLSGQHQHQGLVDPSRHLELLDSWAAAAAKSNNQDFASGHRAGRSTAAAKSDDHDAGSLVEAMTVAWDELRGKAEALASLGGDEREREARVDYLRFQLDELDAAALQPGEDAALEVERARLVSVDQLQSAARAAELALYSGESNARDHVAAAAREVERARRVDQSAELEELARQIADAESLVDDAADRLRSYADRLEGDPDRLALLDDRLALIRRLLRKHASEPRAHAPRLASGAEPLPTAGTVATIDDILEKAAALRTELDDLVGHDSKLAELTREHARAEAAAISAAAALTRARTAAARRLEHEVAAALGELGMGAAKLTVAIEPRALGPTGGDRIELVLAPNKGEAPRPLAKIASGGELSRIMLALKLALSAAERGRADPVATYVFDEVDTGIGGAVAQVVGAQIRRVAGEEIATKRGRATRPRPGRQVLCVTHLPQIAAYADHHFHVSKTEVSGRTETHVRQLSATERKDELARMLGGSVTTKARAHAAELLAQVARPAEPAKPSRKRARS